MRVRGVFGLNAKNFPDLLERGKSFHNGLSTHPTIFVDPNPSLVILWNKVQTFDTAQQLALTRVMGSAAARDDKARELITCLETGRAYVQALADANPAQAVTIIESASLKVASVKSQSKPLLRAVQSEPGTPVRLIANVGILTAKTKGKVFFNWQYSDNNGKSWSDAPSTPYGTTQIAGLTPLTPYAFRVSVSDPSGPHGWSPSVIILVQ